LNPRDIIEAIRYLAPGAEFSFQENDLTTLKWDTPDIEQPTESAIIAAIPVVQAQKIAEAESKATAKAALLKRLGITADEAALLLGGN